MFIHLHCHSHYSFLRGVGSPEELVAAAAAQQMPAVALTDTGGMYAAVPFYQAAQKAGVKPIVGTVLDTVFPVSSFEFRNSKNEIRNSASLPLVLLAADAQGYSNMCRLVTQRQLAEVPVPLDTLAEHSMGVIALVTNHESPVTSHYARLKEIFGDALYLEVQLLFPGDGRALREAQQLGRALGVPLAATNNVHFLRPEEHLHHRAVNAIRTGGLLTTVAPPEITSGEAWFKPAAEMQRLFAEQHGRADALRATLEIAERCNLQAEWASCSSRNFPCPRAKRPSPISGS